MHFISLISGVAKNYPFNITLPEITTQEEVFSKCGLPVNLC
jgi:hypothetical protein